MTINTLPLRREEVMTSKKVKRVAVSSKRQLSIPKEFYDDLGIGDEVVMEVKNNSLLIKPIKEGFEDFSEEILKELVSEGYEGENLLTEFKNRKSMIKPAIERMIAETREQDYVTVEELFSDEEGEND